MPKVDVYNIDGQVVRSADLPDRIFGLAMNPAVVKQVVSAQQANARQPVAHTKTRGEVRGGGKKPWRQKGTGRARHGSIRSPIWRGGGVTFGPRSTRSYSVKVNQRMKQQALFMALSEKLAQQQLVVLDELSVPEAKTKILATKLKKWPIHKGALLILPGANDRLEKSSRNLPAVTTVRGDSLNVLDVLRHSLVVMPIPSADVIARTFRRGQKSEGAQ